MYRCSQWDAISVRIADHRHGRMRGEKGARRLQCQTAKAPHSRGANGARALRWLRPSKSERAQGRPGTGWCPWSACSKKARGRTTGSAEDTGLPCAMVLTAYSALSPGTGLFCPRHSQGARCALQELSASVGAPGPHGAWPSARRSFVRIQKNAAISRVHRCPPPRP
jgi:hypothetical protein